MPARRKGVDLAAYCVVGNSSDILSGMARYGGVVSAVRVVGGECLECGGGDDACGCGLFLK